MRNNNENRSGHKPYFALLLNKAICSFIGHKYDNKNICVRCGHIGGMPIWNNAPSPPLKITSF